MRRWTAWTLEALIWSGICLGFWLMTLTVLDAQDAVVAAPVSVVCGALAVAARHASDNGWRVRPAWFAPVLAFPVAVVSDTAAVLLAAVRPGARPRFETVWIPGADGEGARPAGRRALATLFITMTPGSVVADVDPATGVALLHSLGGGPPIMQRRVAG